MLLMKTNYNSIMSEICTKLETRGRPRKNVDQKLPPISRKLFSEHCAVFYSCCMVYVLEVFLKTKQQKRIGHSQGGFTIYEKMNTSYCFESLEEDIRQWGHADIILQHKGLWDFAKTVNGCAPKFVFCELVSLIVSIHQFLKEENIQTIQDLDSSQNRLLNLPETELNRMFKYIRFTSSALKDLKMEKWSIQVNKKIKQLWKPFLKIVTYTIFCVEKDIQKNKYLKPFFSDAEHPEETIIGQLNLEQIVEEKDDKPTLPSLNLGFTKIHKQSEQFPFEPPKKIELNHSPSSERQPMTNNRRPITLITFPSHTQIENSSPSKLNFQANLIEDEEQLERIEPSKKIKIQ